MTTLKDLEEIKPGETLDELYERLKVNCSGGCGTRVAKGPKAWMYSLNQQQRKTVEAAMPICVTCALGLLGKSVKLKRGKNSKKKKTRTPADGKR